MRARLSARRADAYSNLRRAWPRMGVVYAGRGLCRAGRGEARAAPSPPRYLCPARAGGRPEHAPRFPPAGSTRPRSTMNAHCLLPCAPRNVVSLGGEASLGSLGTNKSSGTLGSEEPGVRSPTSCPRTIGLRPHPTSRRGSLCPRLSRAPQPTWRPRLQRGGAGRLGRRAGGGVPPAASSSPPPVAAKTRRADSAPWRRGAAG